MCVHIVSSYQKSKVKCVCTIRCKQIIKCLFKKVHDVNKNPFMDSFNEKIIHFKKARKNQ